MKIYLEDLKEIFKYHLRQQHKYPEKPLTLKSFRNSHIMLQESILPLNVIL